MELRNVWLFRFVVAGAVVIVAIVLLIMAMRADMTDKGGSRDKIAANETHPPSPEPTSAGGAKDIGKNKGNTQSGTGTRLGSSTGRDGGKSSVNIEDAVSRLGFLKPGAETREAVATLAHEGDRAVAEIAQQLQDRGPDIGWGHTVVDVLKDVGSERARALLRRIALGELSPGNEDWAARALIASDRGEAWNLLSSNSPQALTTALNVLDGQKVDESHMPLLKKCLAGKDALVSWRAAAVMADGAYDKLAVGTVEAIGQSLAAVTDLPGVDAPDPTGYRFGVVYTLGEQYYSRYANALEHAHVDNAVLHRLATRLLGRARDTVILALANRGDKSLREEIIKLAQAPQAGLFRAWAATALGQIGTQADLPLLRSLAESDPMVRKGPLPPPQPTDRLGPTYPVRQAAKAAIRTIETGGRERAAK